jgi:hypothetical protein
VYRAAAEGVFNNGIVFGSAEDKANARIFMGLFDIAVKGFQVKIELA